jgi:hypothetical protein
MNAGLTSCIRSDGANGKREAVHRGATRARSWFKDVGILKDDSDEAWES